MVFRLVTPVVWYVQTLWRVLLPPYSGCSEILAPLYLTRRRHISEYLYHNILRQLYPIHVFTTVLFKLIPVLPSHGDLLLCVLFILSSVIYFYQNFNDQLFPPSYIPIKILTTNPFLRHIFLSKF